VLVLRDHVHLGLQDKLAVDELLDAVDGEGDLGPEGGDTRYQNVLLLLLLLYVDPRVLRIIHIMSIDIR